jgi:hypothetical protein
MKLRILLSCAILGGLTLPAASVGAQRAAQTGYVVIRNAAGDGSRPVVTLVVHGFVLGSVKPQDQARVDVYQLPSKASQGAPTAVGGDVSSETVRWHHRFTRHEFRGTGFRFRAIDGYYRVVVRGSGVYLFAGGRGNVRLRGSTFDPRGDGTYSVNNEPFRSLPKRLLKRQIGSG